MYKNVNKGSVRRVGTASPTCVAGIRPENVLTELEEQVTGLRTIAAVLPGRKKKPFYGLAVVRVATLATFCSGPGQSFVFSVFVDPILADTGISRVYLSTLYACGTAVSAAMVVLIARLADRFGVRLMLAVIALALGVACFGMSAAAGPLTLFFGFAAMRALGQGSLPVTATVLTAQWFIKRRGRAVAVVLGLAASNALLPPLTQALISSVGWREAYVALGLMVWVLLIPAAILVVRNRPEEVGLHPDGAPETIEEPSGDAPVEGRTFWRVMASPTFWFLALALAAVPFVVTTLGFHQISILDGQGLSPGATAGVFVPFAAASAAGTALSGSRRCWACSSSRRSRRPSPTPCC